MADAIPKPPAGGSRSERAHRLRRAVCACALAAIPAGAVGLGDTGGGVEAASAQQGRANVVVIYTDDQDVRSMRVMPLTKRALGREGVTFSRHVTTLSHCCPSRATLFTGQYTHNHGVAANRPPEGGWAKLDEATALPVALERAGYRTGFFGKYLNGYAQRDNLPGPIPPGWSTWFATIDWLMFGWRANVNGNLRRFRGPTQYQTDVLKRRANRFIRQSSEANQPFFATIATLAPHGEARRLGITRRESPRAPRRHRDEFAHLPLKVGPAFNLVSADQPFFVRDRPRLTERQQRRLTIQNRNRLRSLLSVDELVRDVVRQLRRAGELDNTYVIFTSDNGFMLGEHRQTGKNRLYDPSIRVPLLIRGPRLPAGIERPQLTANIDLAPTIYQATGARPLVEPDGISMLPAARQRRVAADRQILLTVAPSPRGPSVGLRTPRYMYAEHQTPDGEAEYELYDMRRDPHQLRNLATDSDPDNPDADPSLVAVRQRLKERMEELRTCSGGSSPRGCR
jgi:N-acetylglucosamine-6-sulfatase